MASPARLAEPGSRPVSILRSSAFPTSPSHQDASSTSSRDRYYAENSQNPLPEIATAEVSQNPPPQSIAIGESNQESAPTTFPFRETEHKEADAMEDDSDGPWYQQIYDRISRTGWLIIVLSGLGIMAVILGILGGKGILSGSGSFSADRPSSASPTTEVSSTSTSTTSSARPSSTAIIRADCKNESNFIADATWIGTESGPYANEFVQAKSAVACCDACADSPGCAGWLYIASSMFTPCTKIVVSSSPGGEKDNMCPNGHTPGTIFVVEKGKDDKGIAGLGPCSGRALVKPK